MDRLKIFADSSCPELADAVCERLGMRRSPITIYSYPTGCFEVALEDNVRGCRTFLFHTSIPDINLLHCHLAEIYQMIAAAKKASAKEITVVFPYLSYARSDKKWRGRMPVAGKIFGASFPEKVGADRVVGIDFHSPEFEGFYDDKTKVDHLRAFPLMASYLKTKNFQEREAIVLPGDEGFRDKAEKLAKLLNLKAGSVAKERIDADRVVIKEIQGEIKGRKIIIGDDEICTAGTVRAIVEEVEKKGAKSVIITATHGLFQGNALKNLSHPLIEEIVITDTLPIKNPTNPPSLEKELPLKVLSVAPLLAAAIREIYNEGSISKLFEIDPSEY